MRPAPVARAHQAGRRHAAAQQDAAGPAQQGSPRAPFAGRWRGAHVVAIASGPSLTEDDAATVGAWREAAGRDLDASGAPDAAAPARRVIAVNNAHRLATFADVVFAMDRKWWNTYAAELRDCTAERWTTNREAAKVYGMNCVRAEAGAGMAKDQNSIRLGGNSGYQAVCLAILFGAARIVLLGYDMQNEGRRTHFFGNHPDLGNPLPDRFRHWHAEFHKLNREKPAGVEILNATRRTALRAFPLVQLQEVLT